MLSKQRYFWNVNLFVAFVAYFFWGVVMSQSQNFWAEQKFMYCGIKNNQNVLGEKEEKLYYTGQKLVTLGINLECLSRIHLLLQYTTA